MEQLLGPSDITQLLEQLASQLIEKENVHLIGIRSRGDVVAARLADILNLSAPGILDISLYRDDFSHRRESPKLQSTDIPFEVDGAHIILVDDVLFTGRTIRAALDAIHDYGRPASVQLAVLVDRGHRELPIQANFVGHKVETSRADHVRVDLTAGSESVTLTKHS